MQVTAELWVLSPVYTNTHTNRGQAQDSTLITSITHHQARRNRFRPAGIPVFLLLLFSPWSQAPSLGAEPVSTDQSNGGRQDAGGTVDIRERVEGGQAITEYRRFGQLYMLKVKPKGSAPLYMIDQYGDGQLNTRPAESIEDDVNLPKWRIGGF